MEEYSFISDNLWQLIEKSEDSQKKIILEAVEFYRIQYLKVSKENNHLSACFSFHEEIDKAIDEKLRSDPEAQKIRCKTDCWFCCQQHVNISPDEADLMVDFCKRQAIQIDEEKLNRQMEYTVNNWTSQSEEDMKCVFLNFSQCSVYTHRPAVCRNLFVCSPPRKCNVIKGRKFVKKFAVPQAEILASAMIYTQDSLPRAILRSLNKHL